MRTLPKYPVYVLSKGRADPAKALTVPMLTRDGVPFKLVVEPGEEHEYQEAFPDADLVVLDRPGGGSGLYARRFLREHSGAAARHWCIDDNIRAVAYRYRGRRVRCDAGIGLRAVEDFTDRYTNVGVAGMNYWMFLPDDTPMPPIQVNCHVYSCLLLDNAMPYNWRLRYNEDTDLCLQVLAGGLCTVSFNAFCIKKMRTMVIAGGNTEDLYQGDGRLIMARTLERQWPGVVTTRRRYGRPQHHVNWSRFQTPLERRTDIDWDEIARNPPDYGLKLVDIGGVRNEKLRGWVEEHA